MPVLRSIHAYLTAHWSGQQSLAWSFWVNLLALRILIFSGQSIVAPGDGEDFSHWQVHIIIATLVFHVLVLCWQIVGVVRSADRHFSRHGNMALVWGTQLGATLMFLLSTVYILGAVQASLQPTPDKTFVRDDTQEHDSNYTISVSNNQLSLAGVIGPGMTQEVARHLLANPSVVRVLLRSSGGNIFEARGLSRLFTRQKIATHVDEICASACTTAYIGGIDRSASTTAAFGFHQYRMQLPFPSVTTTAAVEQRLDEALFVEAGVSDEFVRIMFDRTPDDMWWPAMKTLIDSGVVHELQ